MIATDSSLSAAELAFYERYVEITPFKLVLGQPTFTAFDSHARRHVLLRCFRLPWDSKAIELAVQFGKSPSPFALKIKDIIQRPTETVLVTNLVNLSVQEWVSSESIQERDVERLCRQIGDWMMDWKEIHGNELAIDADCVRIGHTSAGKPYCRILGGHAGGNSADAVAAMRCLIGSILLWNNDREISNEAPNVNLEFSDSSSINDIGVDPKSWLGWLLADHPSYRPPSLGDWLLGENPEYRNETMRRVSHHGLAANSPWAELTS